MSTCHVYIINMEYPGLLSVILMVIIVGEVVVAETIMVIIVGEVVVAETIMVIIFEENN